MNENEKQAVVPYFIHERDMERMMRIIRILAALLVAALVIFVINNVIWMKYVERQQKQAAVQETAIEEIIDAEGVHEQPDQGTD
jgi:flagellar biosynthesis/type III secretory pathway M-ring protein FliF/YscJ